MKYDLKNNKRSLSRRLTIILLITFGVIAGISLYVSSVVSSRRAEFELNAKSEEYNTALAETLALPMWDFNELQIQAIGNTYAMGEMVAELKIRRPDGHQYFFYKKPNTKVMASNTIPLVYRGENVGTVDISLTLDYFTSLKRSFFGLYTTAILFMVLSLSVISGILVNKLLKRSFIDFVDMVESYASGNEDAFSRQISHVEFNPLVAVLKQMGQTIARQMAALQESEADLRRAQAVAHIGSYAWDPMTDRVKLSDELGRLLWFDDLEPTRELFLSRIHPDDREWVLAQISQQQASGKPHEIEYRVLGPDGTIRWMQDRFQTDTDGQGRPVRIHGTNQDITERKQAEEEKRRLETQLQQAQKMESIGNLAGGIAHDFNNILSSVIGFTELALEDVKEETPLKDYLREVYTAGNRAKDMVKQILAFARKSDEKQKPINVGKIVKEVLKLIRSTIPTTIEIKAHIESHSLIMGNPSQIHQLLMNLFTNAFQAMENTGGVLEVKLTDVEHNGQSPLLSSEMKSEGSLKLSISDNGPGIPPDIIDSIFEPYFTTKGVGEGTGMGLAMVHGIVETYGGTITVDSKLGEGTIFTIYLPITKKHQTDRRHAQEALPSGTERILLVDDELSVANMGSQILGRLGYRVTVCTSSIQAWELFQSEPDDFDLVITDMTMPNMTGDELAMELIAFRPDIPVILCTGYSKHISEERAANIRIRAMVYKPFAMADMAQTVRKVLDEAKAKSCI